MTTLNGQPFFLSFFLSLFLALFMFLSLSLSLFLSLHCFLSVFLSFCRSVFLSVFLSLSIYFGLPFFIFLSVFLHLSFVSYQLFNCSVFSLNSNMSFPTFQHFIFPTVLLTYNYFNFKLSNSTFKFEDGESYSSPL